ncbi:MAG: hypothetical protein H7343_08485 [Undibacterium sp.]|nr:hypothetical protein [Opitutaceae bacterium]
MEELKQWFGPKGFTSPTAPLDFRPDGHFPRLHKNSRRPRDVGLLEIY